MNTLFVYDESLTGETVGEIQLSLENEKVTLGEIIIARVQAEVARYNSSMESTMAMLVEPLSGKRSFSGEAEPKKVDPEEQAYHALQAFLENRFFVFINHKQAESLEEVFEANEHTRISFLKLTPLVGG